jgi:hypothetical protein
MSTKKESKIFSEELAPKESISYSPTSSMSEQRYLVERVLNETRDNVTKSIDDARREIPRNTQTINARTKRISKIL